MARKRFALFLIAVIAVFSAGAQEDKPLIQLNPFSIEGIGPEESGLIVSLVKSYLSDIGQLVGYPTYNQPSNIQSPSYPSAGSVDYSINGTIRMERDGHVFLLDVTNVKTGETFTVSSVYKNSGELALKTRSVLESAFAAGGFESEKKPYSSPEQLTESRITGTWKGEAGIELIRLMQGGRGLAVFSSGAQMALSHTIEGNTLKIWQISPNSEQFYYPLPPDAARLLAQDAEPISWELSLYNKGTILGGVRISTAARIVNGTVTGLLPGGDIRGVTWNKTGY